MKERDDSCAVLYGVKGGPCCSALTHSEGTGRRLSFGGFGGFGPDEAGCQICLRIRPSAAPAKAHMALLISALRGYGVRIPSILFRFCAPNYLQLIV
jgi:hypothetical protein